MNYSLTGNEIKEILEKHHLLVDSSVKDDAGSFTVINITYDSRSISQDSLFICKGVNFKKEYFDMAATSGFAYYMSEILYDDSYPFFLVNDVKKAMSVIAMAFYKNPSSNFKLNGITGTAGKTTTTYMLWSICNAAAGKQTGLISTNETYCGAEHKEAENTTPESLKLQELFAQAAENKLPFVTMEVSSQAYSVSRVYNQIFDIGIWMNIDLDHIGGPEHPSYEHYRDCKLQLIKNSRTMLIYAKSRELDMILDTLADTDCKAVFFDTFEPDVSDANVASDSSTSLLSDTKEISKRIGREVYLYTIPFAKSASYGGYDFTFTDSSGISHEFHTNMTGHFNLVNACAAAAAACELGISPENIALGLSDVFVPGRMNIYRKENAVIIVDYAHNRLTLQEFLKSCARDYPDTKINVVIGAAGKNHLRRKDIAFLCSEYANHLYLTEEDPDFEDPMEICLDIASYIPEGSVTYEIITDRASAIKKAVTDALEPNAPKSLVAILGKGMETFSKFKGTHIPYESDSTVVENILK